MGSSEEVLRSLISSEEVLVNCAPITLLFAETKFKSTHALYKDPAYNRGCTVHRRRLEAPVGR